MTKERGDIKTLKVTLYSEYYHFLGGIFFKKAAMGFISSYRNQIKALESQGIFFTEDLKADTDIFQANAQGPRTWWLIKKFKKQGKKILIYAHATAEELSGGFRFFNLFSGWYRRYLAHLYGLADAVICPSVYTAKLLVEKYGIPKEKTIFVSNGVDVHKFIFDDGKRKEFRVKNNIAVNDILVINAAMVIKKKGIDTFIFLAKKFPQIRFFWFGNIFKTIFAQKIPPHPSNLLFYGYVPDIVCAYSAADIFLFPSYEENQGISVLEAGSAGLPVLVRDIPVYADWLIDGTNCLKAKNNEEFVKKLELLIRDSELRQRLGNNLRRLMEKEHSLEAVGAKLVKIYGELLGYGS